MQINGINAATQIAQPGAGESKEAASGFAQLLEDFLGDVNGELQKAGNAEAALREGKVQNMEALMYQIEKSDIALKLVTEIRNKALESYQDIMRMQV
jgi:flagellar hook-basal body complex protein FliE